MTDNPKDWPVLPPNLPPGAGPVDHDDETEPTEPHLRLVQTDEPVPADSDQLPVEVDDTPTEVEGVVLPPRAQPQIRILPGWLRTPEDFASAASYESRQALSQVAYHGIRLPSYWMQLAKLSPIGFGRIVRVLWRWAWDSDTATFMRTLSDNESSQYAALDGRRRLAQKFRFTALAAVIGGVGFSGWWAHHNLTTGALIVSAGIIAAVLGFLGRPVGRPIITHTGVDPIPPLTSTTIAIALGALGIGELNKALKVDPVNAIRFHPPGPHRDGPGVRIDLDLPAGVTAGQIISRREGLASGLRRSVSAVWPEGDPEAHEGRLVLWVADKPMSKQKPVAWPLTIKGAVDLFQPFPIGTDPRGKPITITLMFALMLIGAQPRMGKSFLLRLLLLAASLDVRAELHIFDLRGSADLLPLETVAHRMQSGDDDDDIAALLEDVRALREDMRRRYKTIKKLDRKICPEGKVTAQLASRRDLGLHPIVFVVDECQVAFEHPDHGKELESKLTDLGKRGPAAGIIVILATQRPDAKSIPTGISSSAILRFCLKVAGQVENDMVMGTSAYKNGIRATMFARSEKGVGYLAGEGDDPVITRVAYVDAPAAEKIAARAREMRVAAGLLTGQAAGEEFDAPALSAPSPLQLVAEAWPGDEDRASFAALAERLTDLHPDAPWSGRQVSETLRAAGINATQVNRNGQNLRGAWRADVFAKVSDDLADSPVAESAWGDE